MENHGSQSSAKAPRPAAEPRDGTIIAGRYQVDRLIARGGMAAVYLAHHVKLNRPVALKILSPPPDAEDPGAFEERFRLEAETLASLDHPNIVILHDFGETQDGRFFLAMEYVEGPRLSDILRDGPVPVDRALGLIMQVCAALRYAHKRGVVHRDLKPSNLLIRSREDGEEQIKVVDFGLVKLTEADQSITRAGLILGSPHCMAPEQVKGLEVDHRADLYAAGVLMFRVLTGQYPFHGPNSAATMIAHLNQPIPTFFSVAPDLVAPAGLEEIVRRCLAKSPNDRYADMQVLMDELASCMDVPPEQFRSVSQSHSTIQRQLPTPTPGRRGLVVAAAAVVLLGFLAVVVGGGALYAWNLATQAPTETVRLPEPAPVPVPVVVAPEPVLTVEPPPVPVAVGTADEPAAEVKPAPAPPKPAPVARPTPKPAATAPAPKPAATAPAPKPVAPAPTVTPEPAPAPTPGNPEGYMGLPDDLD